MATVKVRVLETRYVARDHYTFGEIVEMDAERAGKYKTSFSPVTEHDQREAEQAWQLRLDAAEQERQQRTQMSRLDPSILLAAYHAVEEAIGKGLIQATPAAPAGRNRA